MHTKKLFVTALGLMMFVWLWYRPPEDDFTRVLHDHAAVSVSAVPVGNASERTALSSVDGEALRAKIQEAAVQRRIAPIDAKVDRVWKAIPGYNGLEVDVEETWKRTMAAGRTEPISFVYREIPPAKQLDDLGAQPIYKGNPQKPMVSLMINVAWGNEFLPEMLRVLKEENVKATFFFDGSWLSKNIETAKRIQQDGHEMSNHAYSHRDMSKLSETRAREEIEKTETLLKRELGVENRLFSPPSGDYNMNTVRIAHELGLRTILWTLDTVDWKNPEPQWILQKISARLEPGSMILMHPTRSSSIALPGIIREIKRRQLALGTVSELLSPKRVMEPDRKTDVERHLDI